MSKMDWSEAPVWANFLAQDADGRWFWYERRPTNAPEDSWCAYGRTKVWPAGLTEPADQEWWKTLEERS